MKRLCWTVLLYCLINQSSSQSSDTECPTENSFDFIIIGAGATGCVLANRLTESEDATVLVVEAGPEPVYESYIPIAFAEKGSIPDKMLFKYTTVQQKNCCKKEKNGLASLIIGKCLGGTGSINGQQCNRGNRNDYQAWNVKGWTFKDNLKYFMKMEDYRIPHTYEEDEYHSRGGPVVISWPSIITPYSKVFLEGGQAMGYYETDINGKNQQGFTFAPANLKNDLRWSNYQSYLLPAMNRSNLKVWKETFVTKITFDGTRATGIMFEQNGMNCTATAKKEVIVSAGALGSPRLLMVSGIGPKNTLDKLQIPIVKALEGVGQNLIDHFNFEGVRGLADEIAVPTKSEYKGPTETESLYLPLKNENTAFLTTKNRPDWPDIQLTQIAYLSKNVILRYYQALYPKNDSESIEKTAEATFTNAFKQAMFIAPPMNMSQFENSEDSKFLKMTDRQVIQLTTSLVLPKSRGYITINSTNLHDPPILEPNYLGEKEDMEAVIKGFNETIRLVKTQPYENIGFTLFDYGKYYGCGSIEKPTREYMECMIRTFSRTGNHWVSTCKIGSQMDEMAVVDEKLKVRGLTGLRIVDASIIPMPIGGNPHCVCTMVGEKASDIIKQDNGLK